jgi:Cdc6-like AAA superfamily ATPase
MELSGRPLFDNPVDDAFFVSRQEADRVEANCRDGVNTLVLGERGSGKTSLLRHALFQLREAGFPAIGIDAAPAETPLDLLRLVAAGLGRPRLGGRINAMTAAGLGEVGSILDELHALRNVGPADGASRTALLIDLPPGAKMHRLFGQFRDELWQLPFTWIVVAPRELRLDLLTPPANAFFEDVIQIQPLSKKQQEELLSLRMGPGEVIPWRLPQDGETNPRRLLEIARESLRSGEPLDRRLQAVADRELEVAQLGESATILYAELENYGPASASDEGLLKRLGWSRQRAAQVMKALEHAGLVEAERRHGPQGRPRKVFAIVSPGSK